MVKFVFLAQKFYDDYADCTEIEKKPLRPYIMLELNVGNVSFCIPMRSNINHPHVFYTDKPNKCGLDLSKTVVIRNRALYINQLVEPFIRPNEFEALRGKEHIIETHLLKYIRAYKKSKRLLRIPRQNMLAKYSTLQYFEEYI